MKFQIGNIITGKDEANFHYSVTTSHGTYMVIPDNEYGGNVRVISHKILPEEIGNEYCVNFDYFILVQPKNGIFSELFDEYVGDEEVAGLFLKGSPAQIQLEKEYKEYKKEKSNAVS